MRKGKFRHCQQTGTWSSGYHRGLGWLAYKRVRNSYYLRHGVTKSCGCLQIEYASTPMREVITTHGELRDAVIAAAEELGGIDERAPKGTWPLSSGIG